MQRKTIAPMLHRQVLRPFREPKVLIELVDPMHHVFTGQRQTVTFTVPGQTK
jgi:hypothetical protein